MPYHAPTEIAKISESLARVQSVLDRVDQELNTKAPSVSGWSVAQHLFHVVLATDLGLGNVLALAKGKGILIRPDGALEPAAKDVLDAESVERGIAEAPRMVQPSELVEKHQVEGELANAQHTLAAIQATETDLHTCPGWIKHQALGPLQAAHWLRFCQLHLRHHLAIVDDIVEALFTGKTG